MDAKTICDTAAGIVAGDRAKTHGAKERSFANIAHLWNGWWRIKAQISGVRDAPNDLFTPADVGTLMELLKVGRRYAGEANVDNYIDAAGYAACTGELMTEKE